MKVETLDSPLCPLCNKFHMALEQPQIKEVYLLNGITLEYPIQDDTWASRRWRKDKRDYIDLSNGQDLGCTLEICPDCYDKRVKSNDVNVDVHVQVDVESVAWSPWHRRGPCWESGRAGGSGASVVVDWGGLPA